MPASERRSLNHDKGFVFSSRRYPQEDTFPAWSYVNFDGTFDKDVLGLIAVGQLTTMLVSLGFEESAHAAPE